jgi:hypothetical protein
MEKHFYYGKTGIYLKIGSKTAGRKGKTLSYIPY